MIIESVIFVKSSCLSVGCSFLIEFKVIKWISTKHAEKAFHLRTTFSNPIPDPNRNIWRMRFSTTPSSYLRKLSAIHNSNYYTLGMVLGHSFPISTTHTHTVQLHPIWKVDRFDNKTYLVYSRYPLSDSITLSFWNNVLLRTAPYSDYKIYAVCRRTRNITPVWVFSKISGCVALKVGQMEICSPCSQ